MYAHICLAHLVIADGAPLVATVFASSGVFCISCSSITAALRRICFQGDKRGGGTCVGGCVGVSAEGGGGGKGQSCCEWVAVLH